MTGYVQVYTGNGKGKTTAALGLALRAAGAGLRVFIAQFAKAAPSGELEALQRFAGLITVRRFGRENFIVGEAAEEDVRAAREGLAAARAELLSGKYDLVILDEINLAAHFKLIPVKELLDLIAERPKNVELVLTGRNADPSVLEKADLVTEMREVKHYFQRGVRARKGIEE